MSSMLNRRRVLAGAGAGAVLASLPCLAGAAEPERRFEPRPGRWRTFEITTTVTVLDAQGTSRVWLPVPSIDAEYQRSLDSHWTGNATLARITGDKRYGARMLYAEFDEHVAAPSLSLTSRVMTMDRATDWSRPEPASAHDPLTLRAWLQATDLMPTGGIVGSTAREVTKGAKTDIEKVQRLYDWIVENTYREPKVRGCGVGDIKTMLETRNFGGKCGDINGLFVGLARAAGVPARDVYGIRVAPSAFGYKQLGGNPADLKGAQHCRAEVWLRDHGWTAMDPADVGKVMRQETPQWIKDSSNPLVAPVKRGLYGGWEGNWLGFNTAHDVALPHAEGPKLGFFMYPNAENAGGRFDQLDADHFKYAISAREIATG